MAKKTENEVKETKKEAAVMDEAAKEKFQQKLKDLLALAKKKKNMLEYQEISDFFADMQLEAEQFDKILDFLEANNIDVLRITDDDSDDEILLDVDDEDEIEVEKIDLSVPDGVSIEDPVRMYLKEIGKVPLLSAEEEIELAKNMEAGAVAKEKIAILKSREENATEEELAEIKEEIKNLQKDLDAGDEAKKRLAEANLRLVVSIAKRYVGRGMLFLDLIQQFREGIILSSAVGLHPSDIQTGLVTGQNLLVGELTPSAVGIVRAVGFATGGQITILIAFNELVKMAFLQGIGLAEGRHI